jgi:hypothetical protein
MSSRALLGAGELEAMSSQLFLTHIHYTIPAMPKKPLPADACNAMEGKIQMRSSVEGIELWLAPDLPYLPCFSASGEGGRQLPATGPEARENQTSVFTPG